MSERLRHLVTEAVRLAGGDLCAAGHSWESDGARPCMRCEGSIPVFRCRLCGEWDYKPQPCEDCQVLS